MSFPAEEIRGEAFMNKKYVVRLTEDERDEILVLLRRGNVAAHKRAHAHILLKADQGKSGRHCLLPLRRGNSVDRFSEDGVILSCGNISRY